MGNHLLEFWTRHTETCITLIGTGILMVFGWLLKKTPPAQRLFRTLGKIRDISWMAVLFVFEMTQYPRYRREAKEEDRIFRVLSELLEQSEAGKKLLQKTQQPWGRYPFRKFLLEEWCHLRNFASIVWRS